MNSTPTTSNAPEFSPLQARELLRRLGYAESLMRMVGASSRFITSYRDDDTHPVETRTHGRDPSRFHAVVRTARRELDEVCLMVSDSLGGPAIEPYSVLRIVEALELSTSLDLERPAVTHDDMRNAAEIACAMLAELRVDCEREGMFRLASDGADGDEQQPAQAH